MLNTRLRTTALALALLGGAAFASAQTLRFNTTLGGIDVILTPSTTPLTVANFMTYVNSGGYNNTIIHRSLPPSQNIPPYIIQGGGYILNGVLPVEAPQNAPVMNEFSASNVRGTIAMALYGSNTNSATNQWYFNTQDNSGTLDSQDFTVFGNVANDASLAVMDALNNVPTYSVDYGQEADFANLPLQNYVAGIAKAANFIFVNSIVPVKPAFAVTGMADAASALQNNTLGIAPGEILTLYGTMLGPTQVTTLTLDSTGTFVNNALETTQVLFNGVPGPMIFTSSGQIAVVAPYSIANSSTVSVVVSYLGIQTAPVTYKVVPATPALFTLSQTGKGDAAIVEQDGTVVSASSPASAGDILSLYGEGDGIASPGLSDGTIITGPTPHTGIVLLIDGQQVPTSYTGEGGGEVNGVLQINFTVPKLAPGSHQIQIKVGNATSPTGVTLATK